MYISYQPNNKFITVIMSEEAAGETAAPAPVEEVEMSVLDALKEVSKELTADAAGSLDLFEPHTSPSLYFFCKRFCKRR